MVKLLNEKFVLTRSLVDSDGESIWNVVPTNEGSSQFVFHVEKTNNIYVSFYKHKHKTPETYVPMDIVSQALKVLCEYLVEEGGNIPTMKIKPPNPFLFTAATKAGMRPLKGRRSTLKFSHRT